MHQTPHLPKITMPKQSKLTERQNLPNTRTEPTKSINLNVLIVLMAILSLFCFIVRRKNRSNERCYQTKCCDGCTESEQTKNTMEKKIKKIFVSFD